MISKNFFLTIVGIFALSASSVVEPLSSKLLPKQQAKLPGQTTSCCTHITSSEQSFESAIQAAVAVSSQGCLSLVDYSTSSIVTYQISGCNLTSPTTLPGIVFSSSHKSFFAFLTYTPDGSCLIAAGPILDVGTVVFASQSGCVLSNAQTNTTNVSNPLGITATNTCVAVPQFISPSLSGTLTSCYSALSNSTLPTFLAAALSPDGSCLATLDSSGNLSTYPVISGCALGTGSPIVATFPNAISLAFSPDGSCLVVLQGDPYDLVTSFSVAPSSEFGCILTPTGSTAPTAFNPVQLAFSPSSNCFAVAATATSTPSTGAIADIYSNSNCTITLTDSISSTNNTSGNAIAWSPNGNCLFFFTILADGTGTLVTATFPTCQPILGLFMCCPPKISKDETLTFTVNVRNTGTAPAEQVMVTTELPSCFSFISAQGQNWTFSTSGQTITGTLNTLGVGETASFTVTAQAHCCKGQKVTTSSTASAFGVTPTSTHCTSCVK